MNEQELEACTRRHLREEFPLYKEEHEVRAHIWFTNTTVAYRTRQGIPFESTYFDIEFKRNICDINHIEIEPEERRKGHGRKFYSAVENIAREYGSEKVRLTASGTMPDGRSKTEYMESMGYVRIRKVIKGAEDGKDTAWVVEKILK